MAGWLVSLHLIEAYSLHKRSYDEVVEKYKKDLKDIQSGSHIGYKNAIQLAELEYEDAIKRADLFYKYQLDCAQHVYQTEYEQTLLDYKV
jgi:hypothetical protein